MKVRYEAGAATVLAKRPRGWTVVLVCISQRRQLDFDKTVFNAWIFKGLQGRKNKHRLSAVGLLDDPA